MLARYLMYSQVYFHHVRRIYDIHLMDFMREWLPSGRFGTDVEQHLAMTDNEVTAGFLSAARQPTAAGHEAACRLVGRDHFRNIYERNPDDLKLNPEAGSAVYEALKEQFEEVDFRHDSYTQKSGTEDFPVLMRDDRVASSAAVSSVLSSLPVVSIDYVFAARSIFDKAKKWLSENRKAIITPKGEGNHG